MSRKNLSDCPARRANDETASQPTCPFSGDDAFATVTSTSARRLPINRRALPSSEMAGWLAPALAGSASIRAAVAEVGAAREMDERMRGQPEGLEPPMNAVANQLAWTFGGPVCGFTAELSTRSRPASTGRADLHDGNRQRSDLRLAGSAW